VLQFFKDWTLPVAIALGSFLYLLFAYLPQLEPAAIVLGPFCESILPLSVFATLFVTFSKVDFHLMRLCRWHITVLLLQLLCTGLLVWLVLATEQGGASQDVKWMLESVLICVIAPCATAAPVVTAKLGGDITQMTTFTLISSLAMAVLIPAVFPLLEPSHGATFLSAFLVILHKMAIVLVLPLMLGFVVRHWVGPVRRYIMSHPDLGFYSWAFSLSITAGVTLRNILQSPSGIQTLLLIALLTLVTSVFQYVLGHLIGRHYGIQVCTVQGMFQKNTALAIWVAWLYLSPLSSVGAGCYVLWQNLINSYELWLHRRSTSATVSQQAGAGH
jgi:BASS family bile acid:Na+ symporter